MRFSRARLRRIVPRPLAATAERHVFPFFTRYIELRYIEATRRAGARARTRFAEPFKSGRRNAPITRAAARAPRTEEKRGKGKRRGKSRLPALSILIGSGEPWRRASPPPPPSLPPHSTGSVICKWDLMTRCIARALRALMSCASILHRFYYAAAACGGFVSQLWRAGSGLR